MLFNTNHHPELKNNWSFVCACLVISNNLVRKLVRMIANYRVISPYSLISSAFQPNCIFYYQNRKWKWMLFLCITTYYELKSMSNRVGFFGHVFTTAWFLGRLALKTLLLHKKVVIVQSQIVHNDGVFVISFWLMLNILV